MQVAGTQHAVGEGSTVHARAIAEPGTEQGHHGILESVRAVGCGRHPEKLQGPSMGQEEIAATTEVHGGPRGMQPQGGEPR